VFCQSSTLLNGPVAHAAFRDDDYTQLLDSWSSEERSCSLRALNAPPLPTKRATTEDEVYRGLVSGPDPAAATRSSNQPKLGSVRILMCALSTRRARCNRNRLQLLTFHCVLPPHS
jgi:hypothetical protein